MLLNKIIAKNFIKPGIKTVNFIPNGELQNASIAKDKNHEINQLLDIVNGGWYSYTISFEKFYPKFALQNNDMDLEIDALVSLDDLELKELNKNLRADGFIRPIKSSEFLFQIKVYWPYLFPVVRLVPLTFPKEQTLILGNHYAKFIKPNLTKKEILAGAGINAVAQFRKKYFKLKAQKVSNKYKEQHLQYISLIRATFTHDNKFIGKLARLVYNIDDGDILNYGDNPEFFFNNKNIKNWLNSFQLFVDFPEFKMSFFELIYEYFLCDLQWLYSTRTINSGYEIQKLLFENEATTAIDFSKYQKIFTGAISQKEREERRMKYNKELLNYNQKNVLFDKKSIELLANFKILADRQENLISKQIQFSPRISTKQPVSPKAHQDINKEYFSDRNIPAMVKMIKEEDSSSYLFPQKAQVKKSKPIIENESDFSFDTKMFD
ncbi:hypothetical protein SSABA_v1c04630 [Spiroplasma sabaudiense Ar-1343]|uniref:Uncharacterized protein n=1 Tax=Spiroplasma sabaudiense Ar-1343 TaxID=1276257 RepID=W6AAJ3_9MOLU|nr:hypothetical protein [Spiroplasma sabaudiense]AHI53870.1 hypothetical protein SSABA_v1c04630 [Spiroplasma sabaudiense Ar-1343]